MKIGKTATIKGDVYFKENLKIDEGADVDGYLKRLSDSAQKNSQKAPPQKSVKSKSEDTENKKAVNQN